MESILIVVLHAALVIHIVMIAIAVWRVWRGEDVIDRLIATDLVTTLMLAVVILVALILRDSIYIDVALGLAALGFIGTLALAKYVADEQMF
ncbi:MAG: monovalent cation/H+ antiporter complex subunit F [Chloroflexota bacterium]|nr:monovalent cation/H+ antiporter complex subunit F [Chloroflexota bacterium]